MPKWLNWLLLAILAIISVQIIALFKMPSNASQLPSDAGDKEQLTLHFMSNWGEGDPRAKTLQQILDEYAEQNSLTIINESMYGDDFFDNLKINFASSDDPDIFAASPNDDIASLIQAGKIISLDSFLKNDPKWLDGFKSGVLDYDMYEDKIYGVPLELVYQCLFINTDLFNEYNIPIPTTYDDLKLAILMFRREQVIPIAYNSLSEGAYLYENLITRLGSKSEIENNPKNIFPPDAYLDGIVYLKELYQLGAFPWEAFMLDDQGKDDLFINKKAAMLVQGSWFISQLPRDDSTVSLAAFPYFSDKREYADGIVLDVGNGNFYMSAKAFSNPGKRQAAIGLLKKLTSPETALKFANETGMFTAIKLDGYKLDQSRLAQEGAALVANAKYTVRPVHSVLGKRTWNDGVVKKLPYILDDMDSSPKDAARALWYSIWEQ